MRPRLVLLLAAAVKCVARLDRPALGRQIAPSLVVAMVPLTSAPSPETRADMDRLEWRMRKRMQRLEDEVCRLQQSQLIPRIYYYYVIIKPGLSCSQIFV